MNNSIRQSYKQNPEYWAKDSPRIPGDIEQRPKAIEMLGNVYEKQVLEAGCGTGYVARAIARKGGFVTGVDNSPEMLRIAAEFEQKEPLGIQYHLQDITQLPTTANNYFDAIACIGVVHHLSPTELNKFLQGAQRCLKSSSPLVISSIHPSMFYPTSPARTKEKCWVKLSPLESFHMDESQRFSEQLFDINGNSFSSVLFYHPLGSLLNAINQNGFRITEVKEPMLRGHQIMHPSWGEVYDYPSHLIIKAVKEK